jgi:glutamine cyclotransferase
MLRLSGSVELPLLLFCVVFFNSCDGTSSSSQKTGTAVIPAVPVLNYTVTSVFEHDPYSYTEGLLFHNHQLFESCGATENLPQTKSAVGILDTATGEMMVKVELNKKIYFGEGIAFFKDKLYQLTYKNQTGFIYDANTYKKLDTFRYANNEGWALTTDSTSLIMSDGTSRLTYLDPASLKPIKMLEVTENGMALDSLNELEYIKGYIYANRYLKDYIVKIDPVSGKVVGKLDLSSLVNTEKIKNPGADVLNGIAYEPEQDKIFVTGKLWLKVYEIAFPH